MGTSMRVTKSSKTDLDGADHRCPLHLGQLRGGLVQDALNGATMGRRPRADADGCPLAQPERRDQRAPLLLALLRLHVAGSEVRA